MGRYCAVSGMRKCSAVPIFLLRRASVMSNFDCILKAKDAVVIWTILFLSQSGRKQDKTAKSKMDFDLALKECKTSSDRLHDKMDQILANHN